MASQNAYFYEKFVNEENLRQIDNLSTQRKFWIYAFCMMLFSLAAPTFPTFVGYNFENAFAIGMFAWEMAMFAAFLYFSVRLILIDRKYSVFKKRWQAPIFCLGFLILSVVFAISANFTATFTSNPDTSFSVSLNPAFYFLVFLPLYFAYLIFCYYAFMKCFGKYTRSGKSKQNV